MNAMREYAMMLITIAVIGSILKLVLPEKGIKKALAWLVSLVMLIAAAAPIKSLIGQISTDPAFMLSAEPVIAAKESYTEALIEASVDTIEKSLAEVLHHRYGANAEVTLEINAEDQAGILITRVTIRLPDEGDMRKSADIGRYIADMMGCESEIITEEGSETYRFAA